ncbi:hypothetical protein R1sor_002587 [Riccia sorocarpa]|uniref:DNA (cytosine-5-)-methyltransferase n=1 Tax=Riccia sorocarpa TaxID=122646 RepID=A0ABD3H2N1_9MARC
MGQKRNIFQIYLSANSHVENNGGRRWTRSMSSKSTTWTSKAADLGSPSTPIVPRPLHRRFRPTQSVKCKQGVQTERGSHLKAEPITIDDDSDSSVEIRFTPTSLRLRLGSRRGLSVRETPSPRKTSESDSEQDVDGLADGRENPVSGIPTKILPPKLEVTGENRSNEGTTKEREGTGKTRSSDCFKQPALDKNEARGRWPHRYLMEEKGKRYARSRNFEKSCSVNHFVEAYVDGNSIRLDDFVEIHALGKDGVLLEGAGALPGKVLFWSKLETDEPLNCLIDKVNVMQIQPEIFQDPKWTPPEQKYYYSMGYKEEYSTFYALSKAGDKERETQLPEVKEKLMLDLFCGCGGMSTGLCMGARMSNAKLKIQWAVDNNACSCESFRVNHEHAEVYNCPAEDFLHLIRKWDELCKRYSHGARTKPLTQFYADEEDSDDSGPENGEFEVEDIIGVRWFNTRNSNLSCAASGRIEFKVMWKDGDLTWEPEENLTNSREILKNFIRSGRAKKILPRPGECDVICGGPPCQGVSGLNRFRCIEQPLACEKNRQVIVYMDIVEFLKPRFLLMENVVDMLLFADGIVARYALTRLIRMQYQARVGLMAAGRYGVPQFRQRMFMWGAAQNEILPAFPLPTHEMEGVVTRVPADWKKNEVSFEGVDAQSHQNLRPCVTLGNALTDLPPVDNSVEDQELEYLTPATNSFQKMLRRPRYELEELEPALREDTVKVLDHRPLRLNEDDLERTCLIPKKKGACFRDLPGVKTLVDGTVYTDGQNRRTCKSGKFLVPGFALNLYQGRNWKSFGRLWWDETVGTVYTDVVPHGQRMLHPNQDRTLTIRECARLQGFPDYYKFCGTVKDRYRQIGNAVSVPVARALGHSLGRALSFTRDPVYHLPADFS